MEPIDCRRQVADVVNGFIGDSFTRFNTLRIFHPDSVQPNTFGRINVQFWIVAYIHHLCGLRSGVYQGSMEKSWVRLWRTDDFGREGKRKNPLQTNAPDVGVAITELEVENGNTASNWTLNSGLRFWALIRAFN